MDLGELDANLGGIYCPIPEIGAEKLGITGQFLDDAETYHVRYSNSAQFTNRFLRAFEKAAIDPRPGLAVLDLGTGSGMNTIVPCLNLFKDCSIVATDLSPDLLRILQSYVVEEGLEEQVACVCTDAMNNFFRAEQFDVVVGAAILHHLIDPVQALLAAQRALKPGGIAFFFEPFEGLGVLRVAFDLILDRARREDIALPAEAQRFLEGMRADWAARAGSDKSADRFRYMDDKWMFTRAWLAEAARASGFYEPVIVSHSSQATLFRDFTRVTLRLFGAPDPDILPGWAWDMIAVFDDGFSAEMKQDLPMEATIVLRKLT